MLYCLVTCVFDFLDSSFDYEFTYSFLVYYQHVYHFIQTDAY